MRLSQNSAVTILEMEVRQGAAKFAPPPSLTVSEWADRERRLSSESSAEPGQWRTSRAPYQQGVMDALHDPAVEELVVMSAAQVGKSEILLNILGYHIDQDPAPILVILPTLELAESVSKDRIAPMIRDTPVLKGLVKDHRARDSENTLLHKRFPGGHLTLTGANSSAGLSSRPIRIVLCDEVDRFPSSAGTEGDPVSLAKKRTQTFWNRKHVLTSTPTIRGASRIEMAWESSDQRRYHVPCPECGLFQTLRWSQVKWDKDEETGKERNVRYVCEGCEAELHEADKPNMLRLGEWRAEGPEGSVAGFHLNELYSPWSTWARMVRDFRQAKKDTETLRVWVNTSLGETWEDQGETVDDATLFGRREQYPAEVPVGVYVLTAGVDVQKDRFEMEVVGWGADAESWSIDYLVIRGDPGQAATRARLDAALDKTYEHEDGERLRIAASCVDSGGHHTQMIYEFCKQRQAHMTYAIRGVAGPGRPIAKLSKKRPGQNRRSVDLMLVGVDDAKGLIYSRLRVRPPGPGSCHFPIRPEYDEEHFAQLTAEKAVMRYHMGHPKRVWVNTRDRNEALDCRVYALAAVHILNPWTWIEKQAAKKDGKVAEPAPEPPAQKDQPPETVERTLRKQRPHRPRKGGWLNSWR